MPVTWVNVVVGVVMFILAVSYGLDGDWIAAGLQAFVGVLNLYAVWAIYTGRKRLDEYLTAMNDLIRRAEAEEGRQ